MLPFGSLFVAAVLTVGVAVWHLPMPWWVVALIAFGPWVLWTADMVDGHYRLERLQRDYSRKLARERRGEPDIDPRKWSPRLTEGD